MGVFDEILKNKYVIALIYILVCFMLIKILNAVFAKIIKKSNSDGIKFQFLNGVIKIAIIIFFLFRIAALSPVLSSFSNTILMSSSLIVVVLGFIFQEGLSNIIHGFIITIFKPFKLGDRVEINVGGDRLTGYVKAMTLRHTIITGIIDNAESIIPNALLDSSVIRNLTTEDMNNKYPLKVSITYTDASDPRKLATAKHLFSKAVEENPLTADARADKNGDYPVKIDLSESSVDLTIFVETDTAERNFLAATQIKERLLCDFPAAGIHFAYNHLEISGKIDGYKG